MSFRIPAFQNRHALDDLVAQDIEHERILLADDLDQPLHLLPEVMMSQLEFSQQRDHGLASIHNWKSATWVEARYQRRQQDSSRKFCFVVWGLYRGQFLYSLSKVESRLVICRKVSSSANDLYETGAVFSTPFP